MSLIVWKNLSVVAFYCWLFWITLKACNYPLRYYGISLNNFWNPNKQLKYLGKRSKIFIYQFFSRQNQIMINKKRITLDASFYRKLLHQENKLPICVMRNRYPKTKNLHLCKQFLSLEPEWQRHIFLLLIILKSE